MRRVELSIEEQDFDSFMTIIKSLKNGMIKSFELVDSDFESSQDYFQNSLLEIKSGKIESYNSDEYKLEMDRFKQKLAQKYADN